MNKEQQIAEGYRLRAEELRVIAGMDKRMETRAMLLKIAADYENMAGTMDRIDETNNAIRRH